MSFGPSAPASRGDAGHRSLESSGGRLLFKTREALGRGGGDRDASREIQAIQRSATGSDELRRLSLLASLGRPWELLFVTTGSPGDSDEDEGDAGEG